MEELIQEVVEFFWVEIQSSNPEEAELLQFDCSAGCLVLYTWVELWSMSGEVKKSMRTSYGLGTLHSVIFYKCVAVRGTEHKRE